MTGDDQSRPVLKYIGLFAAAYCVLYLTVSIFLSILAVHMGGIYYFIIFGAASVPVYRFRKENGRMYTRAEKKTHHRDLSQRSDHRHGDRDSGGNAGDAVRLCLPRIPGLQSAYRMVYIRPAVQRSL
jgi:Flp pilus assembly protein TadB